MISKKNSIIVTAIVTVASFFMLTWLSCNKPSQPYSCDGLVCENGGHCYQDTLAPHVPSCYCPSGFEGPLCATASVDKYIGTWNINQYINWSDSTLTIGTDTTYEVILAKTATNTTFFINNFFNNANYNNIICDVDSANSSYFTIDTLSDFQEHYAHYQIKWGNGRIYGNDSIVAHMFIRFLTRTSNWHQDSVTIRLYPR